MKYVKPVDYSKMIKSLKENESMADETVEVKGELSLKERIAKLSPDEKTKLEEYVNALKEIKKEISELLNKPSMEEETGGNRSSGLTLNP